MRRIVSLLAVILIVVGGVVSQQPSGLNEATLKAHIKFLSDDMLEGRDRVGDRKNDFRHAGEAEV